VSSEKRWTSRISAVLLIALGLLLGATWNTAKFCVGDSLFRMLGIPVWSNGTTGTHYPAMVGLFIILVGVSILNYTLQKKTKVLFWGIVIVCFIAFNMICTYI